MKGHTTDMRRHSREEIIASLSSGSPDEIRDALISACYWDKDWKWALQELRKFAEHRDNLVLWAVATGVSFIAAFNGEIDGHEAESILTRLKANANSTVAAAVEEAEADIEHFVVRRHRGEGVELVERSQKIGCCFQRKIALRSERAESGRTLLRKIRSGHISSLLSSSRLFLNSERPTDRSRRRSLLEGVIQQDVCQSAEKSRVAHYASTRLADVA